MNPVQSLQHLLNQISLSVPSIPRGPENGIFGEPTLEAVMTFQRDFRLPVTGVVDLATWNAIVSAYYEEQMKRGAPMPLPVLPFGSSAYPEGSRGPQILMAQAMLTAIAEVASNFAPMRMDGVNTDSTLDNLKHLQELSGLHGTGTLDRATWTVLAKLYAALVTRRALGRRDSPL